MRRSSPLQTQGRPQHKGLGRRVFMKSLPHTPPKISWLHGSQQTKYPLVIEQRATGPARSGWRNLCMGPDRLSWSFRPRVSWSPSAHDCHYCKGQGAAQSWVSARRDNTPSTHPRPTHIYTNIYKGFHSSTSRRKCSRERPATVTRATTRAPQVLNTSGRTTPALMGPAYPVGGLAASARGASMEPAGCSAGRLGRWLRRRRPHSLFPR